MSFLFIYFFVLSLYVNSIFVLICIFFLLISFFLFYSNSMVAFLFKKKWNKTFCIGLAMVLNFEEVSEEINVDLS